MFLKNVPLLFEVIKNGDEIVYLVRHPQNGQLLYYGSPGDFGSFVESLFSDSDKSADMAAL